MDQMISAFANQFTIHPVEILTPIVLTPVDQSTLLKRRSSNMTTNTIPNNQMNIGSPNQNGIMENDQHGDVIVGDASRETSPYESNSKSLSESPANTISSEDQSGRYAALINQYGYQVYRENGQRKFCAPVEWNLSPPPRGCEVFVGKLPRDVFEDELVPLFERCGQIFELRLMMDFSGTNRGYAFVTYTNREDAKRSCAELNNYEIRRGRHIGVVLSVDNCRLFVGGIPRNRTREEVKGEMSKLTDGVVDVILYPSAADKTKNRGFAFVEYDTHRAAAKARRKLIPNRIQLWGSVIAVDWAEPEQEVDEATMANVKVLYIRNLMVSTTEETLRKVFEKSGGVAGCVERVKKLRDYAFVHFNTREQALKAKEELDNSNLEGAIIEVCLSKPPYQSNIVRCMKSLQKSNGSKTPISAQPMMNNNVAVNDELMAAAMRTMYAAQHPTLINNLLTAANGTPITSPPMPSPWFAVMDPSSIQSAQHQPMISVTQAATALTGFPFIDPYSNGQQNGLVERQNSLNGQQMGKLLTNAETNMNAHGNAIPQPLAPGRVVVNRGAAGMRSAGFQAMINNTMRQSAAIRRKFSEQFLYDCFLNQQQQQVAMHQQQPLFSPPAGMVIIPNGSTAGLPLWRPALASPGTPGYVPLIPHTPLTIPIPQTAQQQGAVANETVSTSVPVSVPVTVVTTTVASNEESSNNTAAVLMNGTAAAVSFVSCQQLLEEYCRDQGFGNPQYERVTIQQKDATGRDVILYNYKITIPALAPVYGGFQLMKFWQTESEAREAAAQFVFIQFGLVAPAMN